MTETTAEPGAAGQLTDAPITSVTVFTDGARVVRVGTAPLAAGPRSLVVGNLPASTDTASVRVAARGDDLSLLNVEVHTRVSTEPLREQTARLQAEVERWRDAVQALDDEDVPFGLAETQEVMRRTWHVEARSVRPDHRMVGHTGFLTTARRLDG